MSVIRTLCELLCRGKGEPPARPSPTGAPRLNLSRAGAERFSGIAGERVGGVCEVVVTDEALRPVAGVELIFAVVSGPLRIAGGAGAVAVTRSPGRELVIRTDVRGRAWVDATVESRGYGVIAVELAADRNVSVFFAGRSHDLTHVIEVVADPTFPADPGRVTVHAYALDRDRQPIRGAQLSIDGGLGPSTRVEGKVTELADGRYEAQFTATRAGLWHVNVRDDNAHVVGHTMVHVLPGPPTAIRIDGPVDPRDREPFGELLLRARLEDARGNAIDPRRLRCRVDGAELAPHSLGPEEARFRLRSPGFAIVDVTLSDAGSPVTLRQPVHFASAWFRETGVIFVGERFATPIYGSPAVGGALGNFEIDVRFDPAMVRFTGAEVRGTTGPRIATTTKVADGQVTIIGTVERDGGFHAEEFPDGIYIVDLDWDCLGEGKSCFDLVARMSPERPGWEKCPEQKARDPRCLCINVIHRAGAAGADALAQGRAAAEEAVRVFSSTDNVARCCPVLRVDIHDAPIDADRWRRVNAALGGDGEVDSQREFDAAFAQLPERDRCINLFMIDIDWNGWDGYTMYGPQAGDRKRGRSVIEPGQVGLAENGNLGAHEIGHALDLRHEGTSGDNTLSEYAPHGANVTPAQCRKLWENLGNYAC